MSEIGLPGEDDVDPFSGTVVDSFYLSGAFCFNPHGFICGDALILNFAPFSINARAEVVDFTAVTGRSDRAVRRALQRGVPLWGCYC